MKVQSAQDQEEDTYSKYSARTYCTFYTMIFKGAHREQNQPVPVRGFKTFCYGTLNICSEIRGGAKTTSGMARWHWLGGYPWLLIYAQGYKILSTKILLLICYS